MFRHLELTVRLPSLTLRVDARTAPRRIVKTDIARRTNGPSAMPPMGSVLTRWEIRDVIEYLSSLE